jgi:hypothetical protein
VKLKKTTYQPPAYATVYSFAQQVCERLASKRNDPRLVQPEVVSGFAGYLSAIMSANANHLNRIAGSQTNDPESGE